MRGNTTSRLGLIALTLALTACGSSVRLNEVPVEDRTGVSTGANGQAGGANAGQAGAGSGAAGAAGAAGGAGAVSALPASRTVVPVELSPRSNPVAVPPAQLARVVYFDFDSFVIRPEGEAVIEGHAGFLAANKSRSIAVEGHTDERGGREYNLALGQKRAEAVRRRLILLGVGEGQVEAVSFGKEKPAATGADEASFEKNRRAEITYR
ncbi:MAG: peptidoglycan-associated lipoprotein Pal [Betaproteobacteria bacterium]